MPFDPLRKTDPDWFVFEWHDRLIPIWRPGAYYAVGQFVRSPLEDGFDLECTTAGRSAARLKALPAVGSTLADGSAVWTVRHPSAVTLSPSSCTYIISPSGEITEVSTDVQAAEKTTRVRLDAATADIGPYKIVAEMTDTNGEDHSWAESLEVIA